jgi:hypothetical protein
MVCASHGCPNVPLKKAVLQEERGGADDPEGKPLSCRADLVAMVAVCSEYARRATKPRGPCGIQVHTLGRAAAPRADELQTYCT